MTDTDLPGGLHRLQEPASIATIPTVHGPLAIYREDLERIWDVLAPTFAAIALSVRARGHLYEGASIAALTDLANDEIKELKFELTSKVRPDAQRATSGWLRIRDGRYPACDYSDGTTWGANEREAIREALEHLRKGCRVRRRFWPSPALAIVAAIVAGVLVTVALTVTSAPRELRFALGTIGPLLWLGSVAGLMLPFSEQRDAAIRIVPVYRSERPSFWHRVRDDLLRDLIVGVVCAVVGGVVGWVLR